MQNHMKTKIAFWRNALHCALVCAAFLVLGATTTWAQTLSLNLGTRRSGTVITRTSYDYVPSVMKDGKFRMWWCGGVAGDFILYSESDAVGGPWKARNSTANNQIVFQPTSNPANFDGLHTCDPSVIMVNGTYYMYYGGLAREDILVPTKVGVASSANGINWTRMNGGNPIVSPHGDVANFPNKYGAGQPSVTYVNGWFYLLYFDSTGAASNPVNGAGQYVLRSTDPTFQSNVQELTASGFAARTPGQYTTQYSIAEAFSVDWIYVDILDKFLIASHNSPGSTNLWFYNSALSSRTDTLTMPGDWQEGPGIMKRPDGHALPGANNAIGTVPLDIFRAVGSSDVNTWDLGFVGYDLETGLVASQINTGHLFEGYLIQCDGLPLTLVRDGKRLQFALAAPALHLSNNIYNQCC